MGDHSGWVSVLEALAQRVITAQERLWDKIGAQIEEIIRVTEGSALASGEAIGIVNERAREQVTLVEQVVQSFEQEHRRALALVRRQGDLGGAAVECLNRQMDCVEHSLQLTGQIDELAGAIGKIALVARILTLNGQVEAARLGEAGRPFAVIVDQLRELSARVEAANQTISRLAKDLAATMPDIAAGSREVLRITEQIMGQKGEGAQAQSSMTPLLQESQATSSDISLRTLQVLEHLQTQDWLTQRLRALTPINQRFSRTLSAIFARLTGEEPLGPAEALQRLEATQRRERASEEPEEPKMKPGEIVLF